MLWAFLSALALFLGLAVAAQLEPSGPGRPIPLAPEPGSGSTFAYGPSGNL